MNKALFNKIENNPLVLYGLAFIAGLCNVLAFAPVGYFWLDILILMALSALLSQGATLNFKPVFMFKVLFAYGVGLHLTGSAWLLFALSNGLNTSKIAVSFLLFFGAFLQGAIMGLAGWLYARYWRFLALKPKHVYRIAFGFAGMLLLTEVFRSLNAYGFSWLFHGYIYLETPLVALAPYIGSVGIGWLVAFVASLNASWLRQLKLNFQPTWRIPLSFLGLFLGSMLIDHLSSDIEYLPEPIRMAVIQGNVNSFDKWTNPDRFDDLRYYEEETLRLSGKADVVVWPESALGFLYQTLQSRLKQIQKHLEQDNTKLWVGLVQKAKGQYSNALIDVENDRMVHKQKLVLLGEYTPSWLWKMTRRLNVPMSNINKESGESVVRWGNYRIAPLICYEAAYSHFTAARAKTANLLMAVSDDGWFGNSLGPKQHLAMARMRAIEMGLPMVRITNNGISVLIDAEGKILERLPRFKRLSVIWDVPMVEAISFYGRYSYGIYGVLGVALLMILLTHVIRQRRSIL